MRTITLILCVILIKATVWAQPCTVFTQSLPQFCSSDPIFDLTNVASPTGGTWSGTGVTGNNFDPATYPIPGNYTITYTYIDIPSSCTTVVNVPFTVISCCVPSGTPFVYVPAAGATSSGLGLTNVLGGLISVQGDLIIDNTVNFSGCTFEIREGVNIIISNSASSFLTLNTCNLYSCGNIMWKGITVKPAGSLKLRATIIEDAEIAVNAIGPATTGFITFEGNTIFNKNHIHASFDGWQAYDGFTKYINITHTKFLCDIPISPFSFNGSTLEAPFFGQITKYGIYTDNLMGVFYIGDLSSTQNEFHNLTYGIYLQRTDAFIENNFFNEILGVMSPQQQDSLLSIPVENVAIHAFSQTNKQAIQISNNLFVDNTNNIRILHYTKVNISNNSMSITNIGTTLLYPGRVGIEVVNDLASSVGMNIEIFENDIHGHDNGINYYLMNQSVLNNTFLRIEDNILDNLLIAAKSIFGIGVGANIPNTGNITGINNWIIKDNVCERVAYGVQISGIKGPILNVESNLIKLKGSSTPLTRRGIELINTRKVTLFDNRIHGTAITSTQISHTGIYCQMADQSTIKCNWIFKTGTAMRFLGPMPSTIIGNKIVNAFDGLVMASAAVIGPQGNLTTPSDNKWIGNFTNSHTRNLTTNCNIHSPYYIRLNPAQFFPTDNEPSASLNRYIFPGGLIEVVNPPSPINCPNLFSPFGFIMSQIAKGKISMAPFDTTAKWISKRYVYESAMIDTSLQNDFSIDSMMNSPGSSFYNDLTQIENNFGTGNYSNAISMINSLIPISQPEASYKLFYGIYSKFHNGQALSNNDRMIIDTIAFACPLIYGDAVLQARKFRDHLSHFFDLYPDDCDTLNNKSLIDDEIRIVSKPELNIYPNPSSGSINLSHNLLGDCILEIFDLTGKLIHKQMVSDKQIQIDLSEEVNGIYLFKFSNSYAVVNKKLILNK